jgi:hypothetical protein
MSDTMYVVRRRPCGCLVSSRPAKDQAKAVAGDTHEHPDKSTSVVMPLRLAAITPEFCAEAHRRAFSLAKGAA